MNGLAYFGTFTSPGSIVKVDVNPAHTFTRTDGITLNTGESYLNSAVLDAANGFAYFGMGSYTDPGIVVKVDVNPSHTFTRTAGITLNTGEGYLHSAVLDAANGFAYFGTDTDPGIVAKVDVNPSHTFTRTTGITLNTGENGLFSAVLDAANGFAYFGTLTLPSIVVKIDVSVTKYFCFLPLIIKN